LRVVGVRARKEREANKKRREGGGGVGTEGGPGAWNGKQG